MEAETQQTFRSLSENVGPFRLKDKTFLIPQMNRIGGHLRAGAFRSFGGKPVGMYNKYQRIVLDSFPELESLKIGSLTSKNSYALDGMFAQEQTREFRKVGYFSVVVSDGVDRLLWRVRPYEKQEGMADEFIERATHAMAGVFEQHGAVKDFERILDKLA